MFKGSSGRVLARMQSWWEHAIFESKDWIQVEITSACNAACTYCPRTVYRRNWRDRSMSLKMFQRLLPTLRKTSLAYLQGWGEPFLHPDFSAMVHLAKQAGCSVGVTSNGMLLTEERIRRVTEAGLDILAFSLAGTTPAVNDATRVGTSLEKVLEKIGMVQKIKAQLRSSTPAVHIAYMLLRSGLQDLEGLPRLMAEHGVGQAVVSVLDFEPSLEWSEEVLTMRTHQERHALENLFSKVREQGARLGSTIHVPRSGPKKKDDPVCLENALRSMFVSADGQVSPCVYANVPVDRVEYAQQGLIMPYHQVTFGNISENILPRIWHNPEYVQFRKQLAQGDPPTICRNCAKRER